MDTSKIIKGVVGGGRYTVTAPIIKEDYGLYLKIEGLELPSTYEVDFSNSEHNGTSVTMIGNADGVLIPSQFISSGKDVFAFLYHVGVDFGRTVYKFRIPNKLRPDRTDEQPTPEQQSTIDQTISTLNSAVAQTAQDKADADVSAQNASADAEMAEEARTDAQNYATQAEQSAQNAYTYALSANGASDTALQSAELAQTFANNAQASASASAQSATASANSATSAQGFAQSASASAQSASGYASQAQTSAQTASTKASEASTSASTASAKATESAQSATSAQGYAQTAEQAKEDAQTAQGLAESARDDSEQIKSDVQDLADGIDTRLVDVEDDILKAFPTDTASGAIASFTDGADNLPLKSLIVDINPIQDLSHGDPSPENICPISGWTQVEVNHSDADMTNPTTITIDLGQTVYGGKLDVISGVLTVDRIIASVASVMNRNEDANGYYWYSTTTNLVIPSISELNAELISDRFLKRQSISTSSNEGMITFYANNIIRWKEKGDLTLADYRTYLASNPFQLCYELAEPLTIQLTPNQVNSLLGVNNIWADTGDTACEYRADPDLYIQRKMPEVPVDDVQIDGSSIVVDGVANIPMPKTITVTGTTPTITAQADTRYVCGEVATLDFTPSASGICDVVFTSGSTPTVLTVPSTIKWANGFDPTSLDANTTYELNIMDGLGVACTWT